MFHNFQLKRLDRAKFTISPQFLESGKRTSKGFGFHSGVYFGGPMCGALNADVAMRWKATTGACRLSALPNGDEWSRNVNRSPAMGLFFYILQRELLHCISAHNSLSAWWNWAEITTLATHSRQELYWTSRTLHFNVLVYRIVTF